MRYLKLTFILPLLLFFAACGGGNKQNAKTNANSSKQSKATATQSSSSNDVRTIHIYGINKMKYVVKESGEKIGTGEKIKASNGKSYMLLENINAKAGEKLHIVLTTISKLPANAMSHDWTLLKMSADPVAYTKAAMSAKSNDYFPKKKADQVIVHTEMASGGETVEVTFTVPEKTGEYTYLCAFPAHYTAGMTGKLIVK